MAWAAAWARKALAAGGRPPVGASVAKAERDVEWGRRKSGRWRDGGGEVRDVGGTVDEWVVKRLEVMDEYSQLSGGNERT